MGVSRGLCKRSKGNTTFKTDHELVEDQLPILNGHGPRFEDIAMG
jgi:hypothetical protein